MACRNPKKGELALREVKEKSGSSSVELMIVDMSLQSSIQEFSEAFSSKYNHLDVLVLNAAISDVTQKESTPMKGF